LTAFLWRKSPSELQDLTPEEYHLMSSWTYVLIDGINALFGAVTKDPKTQSAVSDIKAAANKAGIKIPDLSAQPSVSENSQPSMGTQNTNLTPFSSNENQISPTKESINLDGISGKNLSHLTNPSVQKAMRSSSADMKFEQYARMGLLDLCIRQQKERLNEK